LSRRSKATSISDKPLTINGWTIYAHPLFLAQLERLAASVTAERAKKSTRYKSGANAKVLANIVELALRRIPQDPSLPRYRQGDTLGKNYKHWFREKFSNGRFRLFFRYELASKVIIYAWVNDAKTLRSYGSATDAYAVFASMLGRGHPPDDWNELLKQCASPEVPRRMRRTIEDQSG
jgi:toxin YhaV